MEVLPEDIIFYLCEFITDADDSKNLRLVQRKFSYPAAKNVFRSLVLYPHPDKWYALNPAFLISSLVQIR